MTPRPQEARSAAKDRYSEAEELIARLVAERDRLRAALEAIANGRVEQRGSLRPSFADAANLARVVLEKADSDG